MEEQYAKIITSIFFIILVLIYYHRRKLYEEGKIGMYGEKTNEK